MKRHLMPFVFLCFVLSGCGSESVTTEAIESKSTDIISTEETQQEVDVTTVENTKVTTETTTEATTVGEKTDVEKAIENRKFYFVSPQSNEIEEYQFLADGVLKYRAFSDYNNEIVEYDRSGPECFTRYRVNYDNSITLIRDNLDNDYLDKEVTYYYVKDYDYFRTKVTPDYGPDAMPPQFWAAGFFPYDYSVGDSGAMYKYWYDVLSPTFYEKYLDDENNVNSKEIKTTADKLSEDDAILAIRNYCFSQNPDLRQIVEAGEYPDYWYIYSAEGDEIVVAFRSYTGAQNYYHIDSISGYTYVTTFVPGISSEEEITDETLNAWDYVE